MLFSCPHSLHHCFLYLLRCLLVQGNATRLQTGHHLNAKRQGTDTMTTQTITFHISEDDSQSWLVRCSDIRFPYSLCFCTCAVLMCWETLSKLQLSSASLGSTTSRQAGPLLVIRMMAWSFTLSTRRLMSSSSSSTR